MRTLRSELIEKGFVSTENAVFTKKNLSKRKSREKLSRWELEDLMGARRSVYFRGKGGAFKQR